MTVGGKSDKFRIEVLRNNPPEISFGRRHTSAKKKREISLYRKQPKKSRRKEMSRECSTGDAFNTDMNGADGMGSQRRGEKKKVFAHVNDGGRQWSIEVHQEKFRKTLKNNAAQKKLVCASQHRKFIHLRAQSVDLRRFKLQEFINNSWNSPQ